ncbi:hypothetical protein DFH07DRAFT_781109 [Mycena maculata]|uniref:Zn(2)-C6 fungal-type domain-containing protein n=1 Tax=Mycena maculata TaxID=230809 RepID=A0AAD7HZY2_9AGAR|nr:hypothetical protein DFH07DRAFT_781109 [Mycena maculata]
MSTSTHPGQIPQPGPAPFRQRQCRPGTTPDDPCARCTAKDLRCKYVPRGGNEDEHWGSADQSPGTSAAELPDSGYNNTPPLPYTAPPPIGQLPRYSGGYPDLSLADANINEDPSTNPQLMDPRCYNPSPGSGIDPRYFHRSSASSQEQNQAYDPHTQHYQSRPSLSQPPHLQQQFPSVSGEHRPEYGGFGEDPSQGHEWAQNSSSRSELRVFPSRRWHLCYDEGRVMGSTM